MKKQTIAIDTKSVRPDVYGSLSVPLYTNVSFEFDDASLMADVFTGRVKAPDYARVENPTVTNLERRVQRLSGAVHVTAFNSGMAAISNILFAVSAKGKKIITSRHLFGNTLSLITGTLKRFGVESALCDLTNIEEVEAAVDDDSCCIYLEIMTNPQLEVADLKALARVAHKRGTPLIADSTVIPFTETSLKELGVDVEVLSSTKYLSGGGTSLGGLVLDYGTFPEINERIKGDLLFTTEAPMGNAALCDLDECSCGQRIITFKEYAKGTAYPALYMYFILSPQFQQQLLDNCTGTTAKGIKADKLKHFLIPLPPLAEQKRIVAKLEELLPLCERLKGSVPL